MQSDQENYLQLKEQFPNQITNLKAIVQIISKAENDSKNKLDHDYHQY